jgi:hypothetical protein
MSTSLATRMLKAQCGHCAYTVRVTRKWLAELGPPLCPCNREPMECAQWSDLEDACRRELEAWEASALEVEHAVLSEAWVRGRIVHPCSKCQGEVPIGEEYHRVTYRTDGALVTEKQCLACKCRMTGQSRGRGACARA